MGSTSARPDTDPSPGTCDGKTLVFHQHRARVLLKDAYALERWAKGPRHSDIRAAQAHKRCIYVPKVRAKVHDLRVKLDRRFDNYAAEQRALTPFDCGSYGSFAVPCTIVSRESGYDPRAENPESSAGGYYQIIDSSWAAYGGSDNGCYHVAACAPVDEQHQVASRMWAGGAGASHWSETYR